MFRRLALLLVLSLAGGVRAQETPGPGTLIDPGVRDVLGCASPFLRAVAFRTELDGHAIDDCGRLYRTRDGGRGWTEDLEFQLAIYGERPGKVRDAAVGAARYLHWWSRDHGLIGVVRGAFFVTSDGGSTWTRVPTTLSSSFAAVVVAGDALFVCDGRRVVRGDARGRSWTELPGPFDRPEDRCAALGSTPDGALAALSIEGERWITRDAGGNWTREAGPPESIRWGGRLCSGRRGDESVRCDGRELVFERPGHAPRRTELVSPASGRRVPLLDAVRQEKGWIGWTSGQLAESKDGAVWTVRADLPATATRLTILPTDLVVLEAEDGRVFRGDLLTEFRRAEFRPSLAPGFDRADAEQVRTGKPGPSPFACMATARVARLEFRMASDGCFHHVEPHPVFTLELGPKGAALTVVYGEATYDRRLDRAEALALVDGVAAAIAPLERPNHFSCTSSYKMSVSSSCDGVAGEPLEFTDDGCQEAQVNGGYSRALALRQVTAEAAKGAR